MHGVQASHFTERVDGKVRAENIIITNHSASDKNVNNSEDRNFCIAFDSQLDRILLLTTDKGFSMYEPKIQFIRETEKKRARKKETVIAAGRRIKLYSKQSRVQWLKGANDNGFDVFWYLCAIVAVSVDV